MFGGVRVRVVVATVWLVWLAPRLYRRIEKIPRLEEGELEQVRPPILTTGFGPPFMRQR